MIFLKNFKRKLTKNKLFKMYATLAIISQILVIFFGVLANRAKNDLDKNEQIERDNKNDKINNKILESTKTAEFNTSSALFFQENGDNFEKYSNFFKYGFFVYHQNSDFDKPFKKAYGSKIHVEYIEYSDIKILEPDSENKRYRLHTESKYKKVAGDRHLSNNILSSYINIGMKQVGTIQMLNGLGNYGLPDYNFCDYFVLLSPEKPYTYLIGPQDCNVLKKQNQ